MKFADPSRDATAVDPRVPRVVDRLARAGCVAAFEEATELVATAPDEGTLESWLARREQGEPPAWITGTAEFCGRPVRVAPGVYVPRPQSEELARRAGALLPVSGRALDLCTGSGAVATSLMTSVPSATVMGVDVDVRAAECAQSNGVPTFVGDLFAALRVGEFFDVITAVAPYVPTRELRLLPADVQRYEPRVALDGGVDGLELVQRIVAGATRYLRPGGWLLLELGANQVDLLADTFVAKGFTGPTLWRDEDGDLRGVACEFAP